MTNSGLIVRRTERFEISLPARVRVAMNHVEAVQFAKGVADTERWISINVVDFAQGGTGFISDVFFPRGVDLELEIFNVDDTNSPPVLKCTMQVKRVQMTDRRPAYLVGCAFTHMTNETEQAVEDLIQRLLGENESQHFATDLFGEDDHA